MLANSPGGVAPAPTLIRPPAPPTPPSYTAPTLGRPPMTFSGGSFSGGLPVSTPSTGAGTPSAPSAGGGVVGPNPYASDPAYQMALLNEQQGISQLNAQLNKEIAQRIIDYGDPALAEQAGFGLDSQSAAFARQNYLSGNSQLARLDKAHSLARQAVVNTLNGHGLLFSGDTGYQTGQADQAYGNNVYDAQHQALADILGYRQATQDREQQLRDSVVQALEMAFQTAAAGGYGGGGGDGGGSTPSAGAPGVGASLQAYLNAGQSFDNSLGSAPRGVSNMPRPVESAGQRNQIARVLRQTNTPAPMRNAYTTGRKKRG